MTPPAGPREFSPKGNLGFPLPMTLDPDTGIPERVLYPKRFQFWAPFVVVFLGGLLDAIIPLPKIFGVRLLLYLVAFVAAGFCISFGVRAFLGCILGMLALKFAVFDPFEIGYLGTTTLKDRSGRVIGIYDEALPPGEAERRYLQGDRGKLKND